MIENHVMLSFNEVVLIVSLMLLLSIFISKVSAKIHIPSILFFVIIGFVAGSERAGLHLSNFAFSQHVGNIALALILFSGGIETHWKLAKPVIFPSLVLSTFGVALTTFSVGYFVHIFFNFSLIEGFLLGAIVSSTDASAVFNVLKTRNIGLKGGITHLLELESGSNDPMAYFLTTSFTMLLIREGMDPIELVPEFFMEMSTGAIVGWAMGLLSFWVMMRVRLQIDGLYFVLMLALAFLTFSFAQEVQGNGFLAVYICGIMLGRKDFVHKRNVIRFHDGLAWLFQIAMFILLGLLAFPKQFFLVLKPGLLISLFLIFIARPLGVFLCLSFFRKYSFKEMIFISWVGLRGAVPVIFATYPLLAGVEKANIIFTIVFFIVLTSVALQGSTVEAMARLLGLYHHIGPERRFPIDADLEDHIANELTEMIIPENSNAIGKSLSEIRLPSNALVALIERKGLFIKPVPSTRLEMGDRLVFITKEENDFIDLWKKITRKKKKKPPHS